jgi:hypothetical protein
MRIDFSDKSFIDIRIGTPGNIAIIMGAKNKNNKLETQVNTCEITIKQFAELVQNIGVELPLIVKNKDFE